MTIERRIEELEAKVAKRKRVSNNAARVREATSDPYVWATQYTKTYNEHWQEEGRPSPYEPFPGPDVYPHLPYVFAVIDACRISLFEKSRHDVVLGVRRLSHASGHEGPAARCYVSDPEDRQSQAVGPLCEMSVRAPARVVARGISTYQAPQAAT
jgi:hypothetical protein